LTETLDDILGSPTELALGGDLLRAVQGWLDHLEHERGASTNTRASYERDVRQFLSFLKAHTGHPPCLGDLMYLEAKTVRAFLTSRRRQGAVSRSLSRTLSGLRMFFRWLEAEGIVARSSYPESPPRVEYTLTEKGKALLPVIAEMRRFGHDWLGCGVHEA